MNPLQCSRRWLLPLSLILVAVIVTGKSNAVDVRRHLRRSAAEFSSQSQLSSGIERSNFDPSVRIQDDFFRAVNGAWLAKAQIPSDRSDYGAFTALADQAEKDCREIIESCASAENNSAGSERQKVGDLYASFMDEARAEELGIRPIAAELEKIDAVTNQADLTRTFAELTKLGVTSPLACGVGTDAKKSDEHIFEIGQGDLGLPDRDYYWDAKLKDKLEAYQSYIERMLTLAGIGEAKQSALQIVDLETQIAKAQWSKVENRDIDKTYNKMNVAELAKLTPGFDWPLYFQTLGLKPIEEVVVSQPTYLTSMAGLLDKIPLATWKVWLKFNVINHYANFLNHEIADAHFAFYGSTILGVPENRPRWKRGVSLVQGCLGEALGKLYVEKRFPPEAKQRMDQMVKNVLEAYRIRIEKSDWLSPATQQKALAKLALFTPKIGYPKKWRDYSALEIDRNDLIGNINRHAIYEWNRDLAKLGHPVDRDEWHMTPQTINAYYNPSQNEIVFPAAILQPPFFNLKADDAVNYGGIGAVISHETGHGFDDQGSKWDGHGNLDQWWTSADRKEFDQRGDVLVEQFNQFEPFPGFKVNGRLTLGENLADLAGLTIAYEAYKLSLGCKPAPVIDGLTGDQRFFLGYAQIWRRKHREADLKNRLLVDPHSPAEFRVNGAVRNVPAFYEAFGVKEGDKLYLPPEKRVKIW
jgi:putative endopeptidase